MLVTFALDQAQDCAGVEAAVGRDDLVGATRLCRQCVEACKDWNDLPRGNTYKINPSTWLTMEPPVLEGTSSIWGRNSCMHCEYPVCATVCPDMALPSTACLIQSQLGAKRAAAFDIVAACSGFIYGITIANQFIRMGSAKNVLVIGADVMSSIEPTVSESTLFPRYPASMTGWGRPPAAHAR